MSTPLKNTNRRLRQFKVVQNKTIHIQYYALLREERGESREIVSTQAACAQDLYSELKIKYHFRLNTDLLRVAVNGQYASWQTLLKDQDKIVFIPPVAGG